MSKIEIGSIVEILDKDDCVVVGALPLTYMKDNNVTVDNEYHYQLDDYYSMRLWSPSKGELVCGFVDKNNIELNLEIMIGKYIGDNELSGEVLGIKGNIPCKDIQPCNIYKIPKILQDRL